MQVLSKTGWPKQAQTDRNPRSFHPYAMPRLAKMLDITSPNGQGMASPSGPELGWPRQAQFPCLERVILRTSSSQTSKSIEVHCPDNKLCTMELAPFTITTRAVTRRFLQLGGTVARHVNHTARSPRGQCLPCLASCQCTKPPHPPPPPTQQYNSFTKAYKSILSYVKIHDGVLLPANHQCSAHSQMTTQLATDRSESHQADGF